MSKCRKLFKVLFAAVALGGVSFLATGCSSMDVSYNPNVTMHEGNALPQLVVNSNGTAVWKTDTEGKFVAGKHVYEFEYTDARTGKVKLGSFEFEASQHRSNADAVTEVKAPTCTEDGIQYHVCEICEALYNQESIPALGHDFTVPVHTDGDCMTKGYTVNICSRCGEHQKTAAGDEARTDDEFYGAHTWAESSTTTEDPTCQVEGHAIVYCTNHEAHQAGQGSQEQDYKYISIDPVACDFTEEHYTAGDCMHYGYTEYTCKWCHEYKMVEGSTTEHYRKYDTEYGEHIWETNQDGSLNVHITATPTCQTQGFGYVYCTNHEAHELGEGLITGYTKNVEIPICEHNFVVPVYAPYSVTTCRTLGEYKLKCQWCNEFEPNDTGKEYPHQDEEYLQHHYDENGLCDNVYYVVLVDPKTEKTIITTRICGACKDEVEKTYFLGGSRAFCEEDQTWHDGTIEDPSNSVVAKIVKDRDSSGVWTGKYILYILATEAEDEDETVQSPDYHCFENTYPVTTWVKDRTMAENFDKYGPDFIPWYNDLDENYHLYRDLITRVEISPEIQSLPAGLFANLNGLETITMEGLSELDQLSTGLFYHCQKLTFVGINDNTKVIGTGAFYDCPAFVDSSLIFPHSLERINDYAFYKTFIGDIDLSECANLNYIGYAAFQNSTGGTNTVILPNAKMSINLGNMTSNGKASNFNSGSFNSKGFVVFVEDDFDETEYLNDYTENVYVGLTSTYFLGKGNKAEDMVKVVDGVQMLFPTEENPIYAKHALVGNDDRYTYLVEKYDHGVIICNTLDKTITDERLDAVMEYEFNGVKVKNALVSIGNQAFTDCKKITRFVVPATLEEIRDLAFCDSGLKEIGVSQGEGQLLDFDETLTNLVSIGCRAFEGTKLERVTLPKTLKYLGAAIFSTTTTLKDIYYDAKYEAYVYYNGKLLNEDFTERYVETISCIDDNRGILGGLSQCTGLTIHIGENVTKLNRTIFAYNASSNLKIDLTQATNVEKIDELCFDGLKCKELDFSNTKLTAVARLAFASMDYLEKIVFPTTEVVFDAVNGAENAQFYDTKKLKEVYINGKLTTNQFGLQTLTNSDTVKVFVGPDVTELPLLFTNGNVELVIRVARDADTFKGYSLVNNAGTFTSNFNAEGIFKNSTVTISFSLELDEDLTGESLTEIFNTTLDFEVVLGINCTQVPENYFKCLTTGSKITLDQHSPFVWYDSENEEYHYCGLDTAINAGMKLYVNGEEITSAHHWDLTNYVPGTCTEDSQGYKICTICGTKDETIDVHTGHDYQIVFDELTTATCQSEGNIHYECSKCHDSYIENNKTIEHKYETTGVLCSEVGVKAKCIYCGLECANTEAEGHYYFDAETNSYKMIADEEGKICAFCGKEVIAFALGADGVTGQLFDNITDKTEVTLLVTSSGSGDTTYCYASSYSTSPLWKYRNSYDECIIGSKIACVDTAFYWNGGNSYQSSHTGMVKRLVIGENVKAIGEMSFMGLYYLEEVYFNANLEVSSGATFMFCGLANESFTIYFGDNVTKILESQFDCGDTVGSVALTSIYLPAGLEEIGDYAFNGCDGRYCSRTPNQTIYFAGTFDQWVSMKFASPHANPVLAMYNATLYVGGEKVGTAINISKDCEKINPYTLNIPGVMGIIVDPENTKYKVVDGALIEIATKKLVYASSYNIPDDGSVEIIGAGAFSGSGITKIVIPDSVKEIEDYAFYGCTSLREVDLGNGLETIGYCAFNSCSNLTTIFVPTTLEKVEDRAFNNDTALLYVCYAGTKTQFDEITVVGDKNTAFTTHYCEFVDTTGKATEELITLEGQKYWYIDSNGSKTFVPSSHTYTHRDATEEELARCVTSVTYCTFCGTSIEHEGHTIPGSVTPPDCMTVGTFSYVCEVCGETFTKTSTNIGHYNSKGEIITTPGEKCAYCGKIVLDVVAVGADGVVAQITSHNGSKTSFDMIVVASSTGTAIDEIGSRGDAPIVNLYHTSVVEMIISDDITSVGKSAFGTYNNDWVVLKKLVLGKNITSIDSCAFYGIPACTELYYNCTNCAFKASYDNCIFAMLGYNSANGAVVYISNNVQGIPAYMFSGGSYDPKIDKILIEKDDSITSFGYYSLYGPSNKSYIINEMILSKGITGATSSPFKSSNNAFNSNSKIYFTGTAAEYETFKTTNTGFNGKLWNASTKADTVKVFFYSEETPVEAGNYWHYAEDGFTPVIWEVAE